MQHTPGPLMATNNNALKRWCVYDSDKNGKARDKYSVGSADTREDAVLFAAAPELLEACQEAAEYFEHDNPVRAGSLVANEMLAAIAKATKTN